MTNHKRETSPIVRSPRPIAISLEHLVEVGSCNALVLQRHLRFHGCGQLRLNDTVYKAFDAFFKQEKARIGEIVRETDAVLTRQVMTQAKRLAEQHAPQHDALKYQHNRLQDTLEDIRALKQEL